MCIVFNIEPIVGALVIVVYLAHILVLYHNLITYGDMRLIQDLLSTSNMQL